MSQPAWRPLWVLAELGTIRLAAFSAETISTAVAVCVLAAGCTHVRVAKIDYENGRKTICGGRWASREDLDIEAARACARGVDRVLSCGEHDDGSVGWANNNGLYVSEPVHGLCCEYQCGATEGLEFQAPPVSLSALPETGRQVAVPTLGQNGRVFVNGAIKGHRFVAKDAISAISTPSNGAAFGEVFISSSPGICISLAGGRQVAGLESISIIVSERVGDDHPREQAPSAAGIFTVGGSPRPATVTYRSTDASCNPLVTVEAKSGTVTITDASPSGFRGSFTVTLSTGEELSGSFISAACSYVADAQLTSCGAGARSQ